MPAKDERMMAGVTDPTIIANRCWTAIGSEYRRGGRLPFNSNSKDLSLFVAMISIISCLCNKSMEKFVLKKKLNNFLIIT